MFSKINNASAAIVASDNDVHLFFECVFEKELNMQMYFEDQTDRVLENQDNFDFVIIDSRTFFLLKVQEQLRHFCKVFANRLYVLIDSNGHANRSLKLGQDARAIPYPFIKKDFYSIVDVSKKRRHPETDAQKKKKEQEVNFGDIIQFARMLGSSEKINEVRRKILMVADTDLPLMFLGESGTGKTMAAQIAHELSTRKDKPFVIANMANVREEFMESALFGNVRGAFTDARDREGLFKKANGGTLFMDEIADLSLECQSKLLRVIESGYFRPVGSDEECKTDVRLIFATNADLTDLVYRKLFREDLYWRIVDFPIEVPALRERLEDFPLLIENELKELKKKWGKTFSITNGAVRKMRGYDWPGNFRQFKACLRRAAVLSRDTGTIDYEEISF